MVLASTGPLCRLLLVSMAVSMVELQQHRVFFRKPEEQGNAFDVFSACQYKCSVTKIKQCENKLYKNFHQENFSIYGTRYMHMYVYMCVCVCRGWDVPKKASGIFCRKHFTTGAPNVMLGTKCLQEQIPTDPV